MFPHLSPTELAACLRYLEEFVHLRREFQAYADKNWLPPIEARLGLKWLEARLPSNLIKYYCLLVKFDLCPGQPLAPISLDCCGNCGELVSMEWWSGTEQQGAFPTCENCRAILVPSLEEEFKYEMQRVS